MSSLPESTIEAAAAYYMKHGCQYKDLAKVFGISMGQAAKITSDALAHYKETQQVKREVARQHDINTQARLVYEAQDIINLTIFDRKWK